MSGARVDWQSASSEVLLNPRLPVDEAAALRSRARELPELSGHFWLTTSGSSALPGQLKWVALSKAAILESAAAVNRHLTSDARDTWIQILPGFHVGGLGIWARGHLSGARVVDLHSRLPAWDAHGFWSATRDEGGTLASLVPTQLFDLVEAGLAAPPSLRAVVIGGGALDPVLYRRARRLGWPVLPSYGLTECCSQVATAELGSLVREESPRFRLLSHVEAMIEEGTERLLLRSPSLLTGYGLATAEGKMEFVDPRRDGWFRTEDRARLADGFLECLGRADLVVKVGGELVDLARLDRIFEQVRQGSAPSLEAALVLLPDPRLGHAVHLACAGGDEALRQRTIDEYHRRVLPFERIRRVHHVEAIPRSALGKVLRGQLQASLAKR